MKLIADSGSTKTDWLLTNTPAERPTTQTVIKTQGINPIHQPVEKIDSIIRNELMPHLTGPITRVSFYGAGCTAGAAEVMVERLKIFFPDASIEVNTDLLGAARALLDNQPGIACILGTGSNSCFFDGTQILSNVPPLGYILGDEGSGAALGRSLLNAMYKGLLPAEVRQLFEAEEGLSYSEVIERVYRRPSANRFLAGLAPFVANHIDIRGMSDLVDDNFRSFFTRNISSYDSFVKQNFSARESFSEQNISPRESFSERNISAVGSIAFYFEKNLRQVADEFNYNLQKILRSPLLALGEVQIAP